MVGKSEQSSIVIPPPVIDANAKLLLWDRFAQEKSILTTAVPLFATETQGNRVQTFSFGENGRAVLKRSVAMEALVIAEVEKVLADFTSGASAYEGLIYLMFWRERETVLPLYIGKTEKFGTRRDNLSANIASIRSNRGKSARWGYNYAYHIGDLSAVVCPGHLQTASVGKYRRWAERLFEPPFPSPQPGLLRPVWFWAKAWRTGEVGIWTEYGATSLNFLEYLLIGVAADLFPTLLLNTEGTNRKLPDQAVKELLGSAHETENILR